jgi:hypothetical protein
MKDVFLFIENGWKIIWKQKLIWLFSAIPLFNQLFLSFQGKQESNLLGAFLSLTVVFIYGTLSFISLIGVPYIAYNFSVEKPVTILETLLAVKKFSWRVIGCSCLGFILISPFFLLVLANSINNATLTLQNTDKAILLSLPLSFSSPLWYFSMFGFFANDRSIWQSAKNAWALFTAHFSILAALGMGMAIIYRIYFTVSGIILVLIQSGFDTTSLATLNYLNPAASLTKNFWFMLFNGIGGVIFTPFTTFVFALAYLKYSGETPPSFSRQR